jgi:hypothetical protein
LGGHVAFLYQWRGVTIVKSTREVRHDAEMTITLVALIVMIAATFVGVHAIPVLI